MLWPCVYLQIISPVSYNNLDWPQTVHWFPAGSLPSTGWPIAVAFSNVNFIMWSFASHARIMHVFILTSYIQALHFLTLSDLIEVLSCHIQPSVWVTWFSPCHFLHHWLLFIMISFPFLIDQFFVWVNLIFGQCNFFPVEVSFQNRKFCSGHVPIICVSLLSVVSFEKLWSWALKLMTIFVEFVAWVFMLFQ